MHAFSAFYLRGAVLELTQCPNIKHATRMLFELGSEADADADASGSKAGTQIEGHAVWAGALDGIQEGGTQIKRHAAWAGPLVLH